VELSLLPSIILTTDGLSLQPIKHPDAAFQHLYPRALPLELYKGGGSILAPPVTAIGDFYSAIYQMRFLHNVHYAILHIHYCLPATMTII